MKRPARDKRLDLSALEAQTKAARSEREAERERRAFRRRQEERRRQEGHK